MCLYKEKPGFEVATEPIKVYKILSRCSEPLLFHITYSSEGYVSPYRHKRYILHELYTSPLIEHDTPCVYYVEEGLHAFVTKESALRHKEKYGSNYWAILEATIPKGSQYAKGLDDDIVSDKLIVDKEICV